jgi:Putative prokaryotic signal transducing protein
MAHDDLVVVGTFNSRPEAELARSALEAAGIESSVFGDDAGGTQPGLWEGRGVAVVVNRENESEARAVLTECTERTETEETEGTE